MSDLVEFQIVEDINKIIEFLSKRDISELSCNALVKNFGITQVDMIMILGNSIPYIAEIGARAYKSGLSKDIMIVGGIGGLSTHFRTNFIRTY